MNPVIGQVQLFAFQFPPHGWAACNGALLPIMSNQQLFSLIGPAYGGNGVTDFALPKMKPAGPDGPYYFICIAGATPQR